MIDGLEYTDVQTSSVVGVERQFQCGEGLGEALNTNTKGTVVMRRIVRRIPGIFGDVDELLEIVDDQFCDGMQSRIVDTCITW